jgi:hypothetical protein
MATTSSGCLGGVWPSVGAILGPPQNRPDAFPQKVANGRASDEFQNLLPNEGPPSDSPLAFPADYPAPSHPATQPRTRHRPSHPPSRQPHLHPHPHPQTQRSGPKCDGPQAPTAAEDGLMSAGFGGSVTFAAGKRDFPVGNCLLQWELAELACRREDALPLPLPNWPSQADGTATTTANATATASATANTRHVLQSRMDDAHPRSYASS